MIPFSVFVMIASSEYSITAARWLSISSDACESVRSWMIGSEVLIDLGVIAFVVKRRQV